MSHILQFLKHEEAATAVEYAVLLALVLMAILGAIGTVGSQAGGMWGGIDTDLKGQGFGS